MNLTSVELADVRNYPSLDFSPVPGLNVFLGNNAQGKSNLLEAIGMLGTAKSFRTTRESDLIRNERSRALIAGEARVAAGTVRLTCGLTATAQGARKTYTVNGESVRYTSFLGRARVVTFTPADLRLVDGAPALRRTLFNTALAQESRKYYDTLSKYGRIVTQKNALLRGAIAPDEKLLGTYDEHLVELGTTLMLERKRYIEELADAARGIALAWSEGSDGALEIAYDANVPCQEPVPERIRDTFRQRLQLRKYAERARGQALVGPHRDDLTFSLGGCSLNAYGSQGQRRTAVLALKVAEYTVMRERSGEAPLLLLDDVLSELDARRQASFLEGLGRIEQAFITSASEMPPVSVAAVYRIEAATLRRIH